jgi:phosphoribosylformimino-5-aminoimidazole carboxamide ribotide isomerase
VIDLRDGRAVRGRSGDRARYAPVLSRLPGGEPIDLSEPLDLLRSYRGRLHPEWIYVADLDRIEGRGENDAVVRALADGAPEIRILCDAGLRPRPFAARPRSEARIVPVIGTEALLSIDDLPRAPRTSGTGWTISLDMSEDGLVTRSPALASLGDEGVLREAGRRGCRTSILLFLRRVGTGAGLPRKRLLRLRAAADRIDLIVGGGISAFEDLVFLRDAGFAGALLATALHEGTILPADLERLRP